MPETQKRLFLLFLSNNNVSSDHMKIYITPNLLFYYLMKLRGCFGACLTANLPIYNRMVNVFLEVATLKPVLRSAEVWLDCAWLQKKTFKPLGSVKNCDVIQFRHKNCFFSKKSKNLYKAQLCFHTWWKKKLYVRSLFTEFRECLTAYLPTYNRKVNNSFVTCNFENAF